MGSCYSGLGSKSYLSSTQTPIDRNKQLSQQIVPQNNIEVKTKSKNHKLSKHLSSSFENISYSEVDKTRTISSMSSSTNRHKIPIPSSKLHKVVPSQGSQEFGLKKNQNQIRRYNTGLEANKDITCDNSSSTSISSGSSINLSKSSFKSSSSSALSVRPQSSIPKPSIAKSRTPTPPMPVRYASNKLTKNRNLAQQQYSDKNNKSTVNNNPLINDRLNGNRTQTTNEMMTKTNRNSISNESNPSKLNAGTGIAGTGISSTSIKLTTQMSGLPRPQTAHIVSTASHNDNNVNKLNHCSDIETRLPQYSEKTQSAKCDPNLRQMNKPNSYFYGMAKQCPYKRPNNINYNANRLQFQSLPANPTNLTNITNPNMYSSPNNSQHLWQKPNNFSSISSNSSSTKSQLEFGLTDHKTIKDNSVNLPNNRLNKSQVSVNKNKAKSEVSENIGLKKMIENEILPKSTEKVKEVAPIFARKDSVDKNKSAINNQPVEASPEHNSISSASGNETDNRDFLIDDEISDQPELVLSSTIDKNDLVKSLHSELEGLKLKQESLVSPSTPSSPTVPLSNPPSTTVTPNTTTFRKPRPLSFVEMPDGSYGLDSPSFRAACQDLIGIKTLLFRLHGILQNAETLNPFDHNYSQNKFYQQLLENDGVNINNNDLDAIQQENFDLKRQIVLMQQQMEDKDRTIRLLQQQMAKYSNINNAYVSQNIKPEKVNACSQTDRCSYASNIDPRAVSDGSNGMLVSFWISKVPAFA